MLHWSFFLALLGTVVLQASALSLRTMCNGHSSGTLLPNPQDCNSYYVCQSGPQLAYCDYGLHFDRVHKVCNWPDWANCRLEEVDDDHMIVDQVEGLPKEEELAEPLKPELNENKPAEELNEQTQPNSGEGKLDVKPDLNEEKPTEELKEPILLEVKPDADEKNPTDDLKEPTQPDAGDGKVELKPEQNEDKPSEEPKDLILLEVNPDSNEKNPTDELKEPSQPDLGEEKSEVKPEHNENKPTEELKVPSQPDSGEEKLNHKPDLNKDKPVEVIKEANSGEASLQTQLSKELVDAGFGSEVLESNGVGQLIGSSLSKDPNSKDKAPTKHEETIDISVSKPDTDHVVAVNVPIVSPNDLQDNPHVLKVPVVVPALNPDFGTPTEPKPSSNSTLAVQVPMGGLHVSEPVEVDQVPSVVPGDIPNSSLGEIVDETVKANEQIPEDSDKVEASSPSKEPVQVIEVAAPVLPVHVLTPNEDIAVSSPEKVDTSKPSQSTNQVIELSVPANPVEVPNTIIDNARPHQAEVAVEKIEKPIDPKPVKNPTQVIDLPVFGGSDLGIALPRPEVGRVPSGTPVKEHLDLSISSSEESPAKGTADLSVSSSEEDSSSSSESVQSSEEELKPTKPSKTKPVKAEQVSDSKSSEEEPVREIEKVTVAHGKDQILPESSEEHPQENAESAEASVNHKGSPESSEENVLKPGQTIVAQEHNANSDSVESSEEDGLRPTHHIHPGQGEVNKVSTDKESEESVNKPNHQIIDSEEHKESPESSEENVLRPAQNSVSQEDKDSVQSSEEDALIGTHHSHAGQTLNKVEVFVDPQTDKVASNASEEVILHPDQGAVESSESSEKNDHHYSPNYVHQSSQSSEESQGAPLLTKVNPQPSSESAENFLHHLPTPYAEHKHEKPLTPIGNPITPEAEANSIPNHSNLIVSILSVASFQDNASGNATISRPIVGAHSTETGHPVDVMTGYSSKNVQCIHSGLYFLPHPSSCQKYFICAYHHLHLHSCGNYLIWNYKREQCEVGSDSRCYSRERVERPKPQKPSREEPVDDIVPSTDAPVTATPMPPLRTTQTTEPAVSRDSLIPKCTTLRQVYMPSYDDCNKYYICILGQPVLTSCPDNMHWDAKGEFCGNPTEAQCVRP